MMTSQKALRRAPPEHSDFSVLSSTHGGRSLLRFALRRSDALHRALHALSQALLLFRKIPFSFFLSNLGARKPKQHNGCRQKMRGKNTHAFSRKHATRCGVALNLPQESIGAAWKKHMAMVLARGCQMGRRWVWEEIA
jgi:hypothetical protein